MRHVQKAERATEERAVPRERVSAKARAKWRAARRFQQATQRAVGMKFVEWLLLETLAELTEEKAGPVSQVAIAERSGISDKLTSYWMTSLHEIGFVDRGPDEDGRAYDVRLTANGHELLSSSNERLAQSRVLEQF